MDEQPPNSLGRKSRFSRSVLAFIALLGIALVFLLSEHRAHALGWLPLILLVACPFLHMFLHGGHGGQSRRKSGHDAQASGRSGGMREPGLSANTSTAISH